MQRTFLEKLIGPSPAIFCVKKILLLRGGSTDDMMDQEKFIEKILTPKPDLETQSYISDEQLFQSLESEKKIPRLTNNELRQLYKRKKLTKNQKLIKSVLDDCYVKSQIPDEAFKTLTEAYNQRRRYRWYLRFKSSGPLFITGSLANAELTKMAYAAKLGSKSISMTLPGLVAFSLPAFYFFHMSYFYVPDKIKPICTVCKYSLGGGFWILNCVVDHLFEDLEEKMFGESIPIDITQTGGSIPSEVGNIEELGETIQELQEDFKKASSEVFKNWKTKTYIQDY